MDDENLKKLLNEIDSNKIEIDKLRPLSEYQLKQLKEYYRIGLTFSSNAIEGNTLTESETKVLLEDGLTVGGKPIRDYYEAEGHSLAFDFMYELSQKTGIEEKDILKLHELFYKKIDEVNAGKYRKDKVIITGSKYPLPEPERLKGLMKKFVNELDSSDEVHPVVKATRVHKDFVFIHPFVDGNGRVARLLMNLELMKSGYNITIIPPIFRARYFQTLEKAHIDDNDFLILIAECVNESQKEYLRLMG